MKDILYNGNGEAFSIRNRFHVKYTGNKFVKNSKQDISTAKELGKITRLNDQVSSFDIDVTCSINKKEVAKMWDTNYIKYYLVIVTPQLKGKQKSKSLSFKIELKYRPGKKGKYDVILENLPTISGDRISYTMQNCTCYFSGMKLTNLYYESSEVEGRKIELSDFLTNIYSVFRIVAEQYSGIKYLGPLRENPKRQYSISNDYYSADCKGADAPFMLAKNQSKKVIPELYPPKEEDDFSYKMELANGHLLELVNCWMRYFDLGDLSVEKLHEILEVDVKERNIADVGFGISQTLPIIVQGLSMDFEQTLLLEQPEIHLHPRMQMRMADFLLTLSQTNHGIIVETHSDHIINRLVRRALEDKSGNLLKAIGIYFVENSDEGSRVQEITIDQVCGISEPPKEFFSQFASETSYIIQAGLKNMKGRI